VWKVYQVLPDRQSKWRLSACDIPRPFHPTSPAPPKHLPRPVTLLATLYSPAIQLVPDGYPLDSGKHNL
jgi:hypothetical protein